MLEVIAKGSATERHRTPLLFVHGSWHGAWCWDEHFLGFFADRGYACYAPSVRGHGASPGRDHMRRLGILDYVDDVAEVAGQLSAPPVLVGHSMGGFIVQKYLERHGAAGAALLAPVPPRGVLRLTLDVARRYPWQFVKSNTRMSLAPMVATPEQVRDLFFCASTPQADVEACWQRVDDEAYRAFLDMLVLKLVKPKRVNQVPALVLGAELDTMIVPHEIVYTADVFGVKPEFFENMGHDMMLESGWQSVAERIDGWLSQEGF
ncbi:alpha/beta hydrolase [Mycobacterium vicinigordonae]|uniref:Alpha/beta fold hydrolase n=1 Tax=Mycobacterium vicinigordonae TaxID=1719132 RepID=A0A7D6HTD1_9MYCO|nr:alpha/beta fold hydrolase [Mycobacterium vicinigordonae]QLL06173.1 alpha/beta fold hydrolase [Mycobacterium vicinigordonae]